MLRRLGDCNKSGNFKLLSLVGFTASKIFIEIIHNIYSNMSNEIWIQRRFSSFLKILLDLITYSEKQHEFNLKNNESL
jgi:hypothetical protein